MTARRLSAGLARDVPLGSALSVTAKFQVEVRPFNSPPRQLHDLRDHLHFTRRKCAGIELSKLTNRILHLHAIEGCISIPIDAVDGMKLGVFARWQDFVEKVGFVGDGVEHPTFCVLEMDG